MKGKKKLKYLLSILLSLVLMLGLMPGLSLTAYAATLDNESTIWSENSVIAGDVTINNNVTVNADITLTIPEGKILTINGQSDYSDAVIYCDNNSILTVSGGGTLIVNAPAEEVGHSPIDGFCGNLIVDGATVQVTGEADGVYGNVTVKSGSVCVNGGNGEAGCDGYSGIAGVVIVNGGSITVVGGNGGNGDNYDDGGDGGYGVCGGIILNGGSATITGGNGGTKGSDASDGYSGQAVYGSITGNAEESEDNTNWTSVTDNTSSKQYVKFEHILVTGLTLDKTTTQIIDEGNKVSFTATVAPDNAFDKTVKWSVGGTNATAVKLYSDENCTTEVGTDATETLTVYAKGISAGSATVTCTSNADSTKSASCNVTVNAYAGNPYASLVNTTTSVEFNEMDWYIIADDSTAVDAGTVTLLSKDPIEASKFHESQDSVYVYSISLVKGYLDSLTGTGGTFEAVADAIVTVKVKGSDSDSEVDAKLWLLSTSEAEGLSEDVRKCSTAMSYFWWLRSRGYDPNKAARVESEDGNVSGYGDNAWYECGVRPALKLDLSKVTFDSGTKKFELTPAVEYPLWVGGVQVTSANKDDVLGDTDEGATVSYDVDTNTLTLNGVDIAAGYTEPGYNSTSGIYYSGNDSLSIVLSADSDNKVGVNGDVQIGIESSRNITISGAGKLTVKGSGNYSVGIEAYALTIKDAEINVEGGFNGIQTQKYGYGVNIISGKVNAIGQIGTGIHSGLRDVNYQTSAVTIGENATVVAIGGNKAINYLKNAIAGTGWTDTEGTTGKASIAVSEAGQELNSYKKVQFPAVPDPVAYIDHNATTGTAETKACTSYTAFVEGTNSTLTTIPTGWYVIISGNAIATNRLVVSGTVNLILCDGATLIARKGITVTSGNTLNIYAGSIDETILGTGKLYAGTTNGIISTCEGECAGIGGNVGTGGGKVTIHGGEVTAWGNTKGAGIGGGNGGAGGTVTIYGGTVTTSGDGQGKGIGAGHNGTGNGKLTLGTGMYLYGGTSANPENDPSNNVAKVENDYARSQYMTVNNSLPHSHDFTYTENGAVITATCANSDQEHIGDTTSTLTIVKPALTTYGGTGSETATLSGLTAFNSATGLSVDAADIKYVGRDGTSYDESATAPTNAGKYTAKITITGVKTSEGDDKSVTACVDYEIARIAPVADDFTFTAPSDLNYDGTAKSATVTAASTAKGMGAVTVKYYSDAACSTEAEPVNAGTYYVGITVTEGDNYNATTAVLLDEDWVFKINRANATSSTITVNNRTYDGTEKPLVTEDKSTLVGGEMWYALGENATTAPADDLYTTSIPTGTNAGT